MHISLIMGRWMHGPGDIGPTSAGQVTLDYIARQVCPGHSSTVSFVDGARWRRAIAAAEKGGRGDGILPPADI